LCPRTFCPWKQTLFEVESLWKKNSIVLDRQKFREETSRDATSWHLKNHFLAKILSPSCSMLLSTKHFRHWSIKMKMKSNKILTALHNKTALLFSMNLPKISFYVPAISERTDIFSWLKLSQSMLYTFRNHIYLATLYFRFIKYRLQYASFDFMIKKLVLLRGFQFWNLVNA
jgi:hypothetical protein